MRVLLVDNYDSFSFNLVQALRALGAEVDVRRNDAVSAHEAVSASVGAIVVSPGPKGPRDAGVSIEVVRAAAAARRPLLGVCLGHQALGAAFGGEVVRAPRPVHGKTSLVGHGADPLFAGVPAPFEAMRYHSLVVAEPLPPPLVVLARCEQPGGELMAMRHAELPLWGVQFHPESYRTAAGPAILRNFLTLAGAQ